METRFKVLRYIAYTIEILVLFIVQETPGLIPAIYGAKPVILIPIALSIALFESELTGMAFGVFCGLLTDAGIGGTLGFHAILLAVLCYLIGILVTNLMKTNLITAVIVATICIPVIFLLQWFFQYMLAGYDHNMYALYSHYLPVTVYTWSLTPLFYFFNHAFAAGLRPKE